jgi:hypothetical protein
MTVKELVDKLTNEQYYEKYKDMQVEKAIPTGDKAYVGEEITRVFFTDNILGDKKMELLPADKYRKAILF